MWKVLIADDEPKIRKGLRNSLSWEELDLVVAGEAEDGEMALEMAKEIQPDILLVDICMPFLNGLQFIEKLNQAVKNCIVIIITGHDEFTYAQQAVKLHVFDYLLKPVSRQQLVSVLTRAKEEAEQFYSQNKYVKLANEQVEKNLPLLQERFLNEWINGHLSSAEIEEQLAFFSLPKPNEIVLIKLVDKFSKGEILHKWDKALLVFAMQNIIEELCKDFYDAFLVFKDNKDEVIIIAAAKDTTHWLQLKSSIEKNIELYLKRIVLVNQRTVQEAGIGLPEVYEEMQREFREQESFTPIVLLSQRYIEKYYHKEDLSLHDLAEEMQISATYLSRLLKQEIGVSFIDYLTQVRVKKAIQLMNDPHLKMYEIAEQVGYSSQHYFSTAFKKVIGVSPVEYRKGKV